MENAPRQEPTSSGPRSTQPRVRPRTRPPSFRSGPSEVSFESESFAEAYGAAAYIGFLVVVFFGSVGFLLWPSASEDDGFLTAEEVRVLTNAARSEVEGSEAYPSPGRTSSLESQTDVEAGAVALSVETAPSGALVSINGDTAGETPLDVHQLTSNWHVVAVEKDGFIAQDTLIYVDRGAPARVMLALTPSEREQEAPRTEPETSRETLPSEASPVPPTALAFGTIGVAVRPAGVPVRLDGERVGTAPLEVEGVSPGSHTLTFSMPGYETATADVDVEAGTRASVDVALVPLTGGLSVVVRPWGSIYIDGTLRARDTDVRFDTSLPVGRHHVRVVHPELGTRERTVEVQTDRTASATFYFE